ncbi:MAG TPA: hypothetical protein VK654_04055 [Nitrospirota bacterium]|nr:hypothetical protein [Nitrospirota bacterium]
MTIFSAAASEAIHLYSRLSKLKPSILLDREQSEPQDVVHISAEAKKRQILEQARTEVLAQIRNTR